MPYQGGPQNMLTFRSWPALGLAGVALLAALPACGPSHSLDRPSIPTRADSARPANEREPVPPVGPAGQKADAAPDPESPPPITLVDAAVASGSLDASAVDAAAPLAVDAASNPAPTTPPPVVRPPDAAVRPPDMNVAPPPMPPRDAAPPPTPQPPVDMRPATPADPGGPGCPPPSAPDEIISLFEDGALSTNPMNGRGGTQWNIINDNEGAVATVSIPEQPVRCGSRRALRFAGMSSPTKTPIVRLLFIAGTPQSFYDARAYKGIRLSLRSGVAGKTRLKVPDRNTSTSGGLCMSCNDHFGVDLDITPEWKTFVVPFSSLTQTGVGDPQPGVAVNALLGVELVLRQATFELFIDDVVFFR